jgi:hypothetical protein
MAGSTAMGARGGAEDEAFDGVGEERVAALSGGSRAAAVRGEDGGG